MPPCRICGERAKTGDLCAKHYAWALRNGLSQRVCEVPDCDGPHYSSGYCLVHYRRMRQRGTTDAPYRRSTEERFWEKVDRNGPVPDSAPTLGPCWLWTAAHTTLGYGSFGVGGGRNIMAHRWSYEQIKGPIPPGYHLDHLCRTAACVNPDHLEAVPPRENTRRAYFAILPHCPTCTCASH